MAHDLVLRGGTVHDGTGVAPRPLDIGLSAGRIAELGTVDGDDVLDITGLAVAPGFIDTHTHTDATAWLGPDLTDLRLASLRQGVTTEICGNCGYSLFPCAAGGLPALEQFVQGTLGATAPSFADFPSLVAALEARELPVNLAPLVGHGAVRAGSVGLDRRPATAAELDTMSGLVDDALSAGAFGLSTGLIYVPGMYADTAELVTLATLAARYDVPYTTHLRSEFADVHLALEEALSIGRHSGAAVHLSHLKTAGRANYGRSREVLGLVEAAHAAGQDVTVDVYPYTAGSTVLQAMLPPWATEGGTSALLERLRSADVRRRIEHDIDHGLPGWPNNLGGRRGWEDVAVASAAAVPAAEGRRISELAVAEGRPEVDVAADLLLACEGTVLIVIHQIDEADVRNVLSRPYATIGSDGIPVPGKPHPRLAGTFARVLGHYTRELGVLDLTEAVRRMTSLPADRFGLRDRGRVQVGAVADLVVFDPATVLDRATYDDPLLPPTGVHHVLLAGQVAVREGRVVDATRGTVLRRTAG